jgi:branched-chain amino acid transport system substrate-binding protein
MTPMKTLTGLLAAATIACGSAAAHAETFKIGFMTTLTGPSAALGQHLRDGFLLGLKEMNNKLGGLDAEVVIADDELKPDLAISKIRALIERDRVDILGGIIFSNVMMAVYKPVRDADKIFVSGNAGPSPIAGAQCSENFFSTSWQNDGAHEAMGQYAKNKGWTKVVVMAPNYQAGKDAIAGFKRFYGREPMEEVYTQLNQLDFQSELARIASMNPEAIYTLMPGGMGVNLVKQYRQAGLAGRIPLLSAFTVDETTLPATQDAAIDLPAGAPWAPNIDNPLNKKFVEGYEKAYGHPPSMYAAQGYDLARILDAALKKSGGKKDTASLREAFKTLSFESVAGDFKLNRNGFPIRDFYLVKAVKRTDGKYVTSMVEKILDDHQDAYVKDCSLK